MDENVRKVLPFLGWTEDRVDTFMEQNLSEAWGLLREGVVPQKMWKIFDAQQTDEGVRLTGTDVLLTGEDAKQALGRATKVALIATTLGVEADHLIQYWSRYSITHYMCQDACAKQFASELCDDAVEEIRAEAAKSGLSLTAVLKPGQGDLPIESNGALVKALDSEAQIGVRCTPNFFLIPQKSLTALVGLEPS